MIPEELAPAERLEVRGMRMIRTPETRAGLPRTVWTKRFGRMPSDARARLIGAGSTSGSSKSRAAPMWSWSAPPLTRTGEDGEWRLFLSSVRDRHLQGELTAGASRFQVRGLGRGGRIAPAETHGYHVLRDGRVVAAVETVAPGAVWLAPGLDAGERRMLAKGAMALLLYEEPHTDQHGAQNHCCCPPR